MGSKVRSDRNQRLDPCSRTSCRSSAPPWSRACRVSFAQIVSSEAAQGMRQLHHLADRDRDADLWRRAGVAPAADRDIRNAWSRASAASARRWASPSSPPSASPSALVALVNPGLILIDDVGGRHSPRPPSSRPAWGRRCRAVRRRPATALAGVRRRAGGRDHHHYRPPHRRWHRRRRRRNQLLSVRRRDLGAERGLQAFSACVSATLYFPAARRKAWRSTRSRRSSTDAARLGDRSCRAGGAEGPARLPAGGAARHRKLREGALIEGAAAIGMDIADLAHSAPRHVALQGRRALARRRHRTSSRTCSSLTP